MVLLENIKARFKDRKNKSKIEKAVNQEKWLRFHCTNVICRSEQQELATNFLNWVRQILPADKFSMFLTMFKYPLPTLELTEDIFKALEKVCDARNPYFNYTFSSQTYKDEWQRYSRETLNEPRIWRSQGMSHMKSMINSILVVDMPREKNEPYFYWLNVANVIDFELKADGCTFEWLMFYEAEKKVAIFTEEAWCMYDLNEKNELTNELIAPHKLGYCPARTFWTTPLNESEKFVKESPISSQLANLDWLLFFAIGKRNLDSYAPYPIYSGYEQHCNFENPQSGETCDGGFLKDKNGFYTLNNGAPIKCPICAIKNVGGIGSFVEVPVPSEENDFTDLRNPVSITTIDRESLDYNVSEVERLAKQIKDSILGGAEPVNDQAINEKQVDSIFADRKNILMKVKKNFELAQKFVDDTIARLMYGGAFKESDINWGDEYLFYSVPELRDMYNKAKTSGASDADLDSIYDKLIATENKNNPLLYKRMTILRDLEPFRNLSKNEVLTYTDKQLATIEDFLLKADFSNFISKFERENTNVVDFGSELEYRKKIDIIKQTLLDYVKEQQKQGSFRGIEQQHFGREKSS